MITDNYLDGAIETIGEVKKEMEYEISRLQKHEVDTGNLEHIQRLIKKVDSFLSRIKEAYS
jgi:hypothetical protein